MSLTTITVLDADAEELEMRAWDESGNGAGPFAPVSLLIGKTVMVNVTLSLDTGIYASGDLLAETQAIASTFRANNYAGMLQSLVVIDKDDQKAAFDVYVLDQNVTFGAENGAPSISDANAVAILGVIAVGTADYKDLGGVSIATFRDLALPIRPVTDTSTLYVAVVNGSGTPTYTASGIVLRIGVQQD